jgi:dCMP deaminase
MIEQRELKWHRRFLAMADMVASWSKDPSTKVGAVIARGDRSIASVGYNGFPRGMSDDAALYADRETKYSRIIHAEVNALLNAREQLTGCTIYVPTAPCDRCAAQIVQAGIARVVYIEPSADILSRWGESMERTKAIFADAGVEVLVLPAVA